MATSKSTAKMIKFGEKQPTYPGKDAPAKPLRPESKAAPHKGAPKQPVRGKTGVQKFSGRGK